LKKIVLTGPESTGKTTLAKQLALHYDAIWVPEFARDYLAQLNRPYEESDLLEIAKGQVHIEESCAKQAGELLICDTDLLVMKVWSEFKYGKCDPWILEQVQSRHYDVYLLCGIDIPWEQDPLRENPGQREELHQLYERELKSLNKEYLHVEGATDERLNKAIAQIGNLF